MFSVQAFTSSNEGQKTVLYSKTGGGKTTLAAMLDNPIFLGLDDGGRRIKHPKTGEDLKVIGGISSFQDFRDALNQKNLWDGCGNVVIDTITKAETWMEEYICATMPLKGGARATSLRAYGWDGAAHLAETLRLILSDLDQHIRAGRNVCVLSQQAQVKVANSAGVDYLEDGPKLQHNNQYSSRMELCEWADHVLRIGYLNFSVALDNEKAKAGKVQNADETRAIFSGGAAHYVAKSRPINGQKLPAVISFAHEQDDSLWQMMFHGAIPTE